MKKRILFVFIVFLSAPTSVHAWSYAEHVSITKSAFEEACLDINFQENLDENGNYKISKYCSKPYQYCYAHMVAMSGDRFSGLESISTTRSITKNKTFSKCLDVLSSNTANINLDKKIKTFESKAAPDSKDRCKKKFFSWPKSRQVEHDLACNVSFIKRIYRKVIGPGILASKNESHFHHGVTKAWKKCYVRSMKPENFTHENENESPGKHCNNYKNKDVQGSKNKKYIKALYNNQAAPDEIDADINHAFSTHFLQDSFSAGHIGINRADYRQDFDHAYHDDINELGIIMSNSKNEWFSYGDTNLDKASWHVFVDFNKIRTLSKLINVFNNNQEYSAQQFNLSNGATTEEGDIKFTSFENSTLVLNNDMLLLETHDFKKSCNKLLSELVVACDHTQVVVRSIKHKTRRDFEKHNSEPSQSDCTPVETNVDGIEVYRCKNSIIQVQKATKQNIEAWLCHQKLHSKCDYQKIIKNLMPIAYKKIISYKDTAVNLKPYVEQGITKINVDKNDAINNYQKTSFEKAYLSASTLTTRQGVPSINFGVELTRKPFSFKDTSFDISSTVEVEIYNFNENNYLNSLSMSFKSELPRPKPIFNGHIGISAVAGFGWTNIWKGGRSADFYGLYGAQANLYLGRHGIFLNALKRAGIKSNRDDGTLFQLGYSLSMLNL